MRSCRILYDGARLHQNPLKNTNRKVLRSFYVRKILLAKEIKRNHTEVL